MTKKHLCIITICLGLLSGLGNASTLINGAAIHSELGRESFIGALYTTNFSSSAKDILLSQEPKQIQVRILADRLSSRRFKRMWIEGLAINASSTELENQSQNMAAFSNMLKVTLLKGDIFAVQRSNSEVNVLINGTLLGTIDDPLFFDLLLRTWIGPVPLSSSFRSALLSGGNTDDSLLSRFSNIKPSDERITAVASALLTAEQSKQEQSKKENDTASIPTPITKPVINTVPTIAAPVIPSDVNASKPEPEVVKEESTPVEEETKEDIANTTDENATEVSDSILEEDEDEFTAESLLAQQLYIAKLKKWTYRKLSYPKRSLDREEQGTVRLSVIIDRAGKVRNVSVAEDPGYKRLTNAALKAVEKSAPYPSMPEELKDEEFEFSLPIVFKLVGK